MVRIGFIGAGIMGCPMAANLLRAGYRVSVISRRPKTREVLEALGAAVAELPRQIALTSDVIVMMLPDTQAVDQVLFGNEGIVAAAKSGLTIIDMGTISPRATVAFAQRLALLGCEMLDAPVSGGEKGACAGTLGIMVGGSREVFERCKPIFQVLGSTVTYVGTYGNGQKTKLVNQLVGATNLLAAVEGIRLARAAGLDPETTFRAISSGAASSWMLANLGPMILKEDFAPGFHIRLQHKDLELLSEWIFDLGGEFPAANLVHSLFEKAVKMGLEDQGNQGLINIWGR